MKKTVLLNLQEDFINYIQKGIISKRLEENIEENGLSMEDKLNVYKDNVFQNAINALQGNYPFLYKLIGEDDFRKISYKFVENEIPKTGVLNEYGNAFGDFISRQKGMSEYGFISELARFETKINKIQMSDPEEYLSANSLADKIHRNQDVELGLVNNLEVINSKYNLIYLTDLIDSEDMDVDDEKLNNDSAILLRKADGEVKSYLLKDNELWVINLIKNGKSFQSAVETIDSEEEASSLVARLLNFKVIKEIQNEKN